MKKTTKEKKKGNKKNKSTIFDFDSEVTSKDTKKRKTRKVTKKKKKNEEIVEELLKVEDGINNNLTKNSKKKIKQLKKKKNREKQIKEKEKAKLTRKNRKEEENKRISWQEMQQMKRVKKAVKYTFIVFILCCLAVLFVLSPVFNIREINVLKNERISKESIIGLLNVKGDTNILKENNKIIKEKLKVNPYINVDKTTIRRILPSTLIISISEREIEYLLEFGNVYAYIDNEGNILEISSQDIKEKLKLKGYETPIDTIKEGNKLMEKDITKVKDITQILKVAKNFELDDKITSIDIKNDNDYILYMDEENKSVHVGNIESLDTKMLYVKAILEKEKENDGEIFVNVDLNNKNAYFKQNV